MDKKTKKALDEATIRKLAGLYPVSPDFSMAFMPDCYKDVPQEYKPKFIIKPYTLSEMRDLAEKSNQLEGQELDDFANSMIRSKIVGMTNMINLSTQEPILFQSDEKGCMSKSQYDTLPMIVKSEILKEISAISSGVRS